MARLPLPERRQQLVEAAIAVMTREGVHKATTRAVAAESGTSLSVFHYCFDSKAALLDAVITTIVDRTVTLAEATFDTSSSQLDTIKHAFRAYWSHVIANPEEHLLTYEVTQYCLRDAGLRHVAELQYERYGRAYVALFDAAGLTTRVPVETVTRYLAVVIDGLTLDWLARRDDEQALAVLDVVAEHVNTLLLPR
jgi:AcrR family transcriptional regulator